MACVCGLRGICKVSASAVTVAADAEGAVSITHCLAHNLPPRGWGGGARGRPRPPRADLSNDTTPLPRGPGLRVSERPGGGPGSLTPPGTRARVRTCSLSAPRPSLVGGQPCPQGVELRLD